MPRFNYRVFTGVALAFLAAAFALLFTIGVIALHGYATYIAYHDGTGVALITFVTPGLSELFWFGAAWHATGTLFTPYGCWFMALPCIYGASALFAKLAIIATAKEQP